jgi:MinD superfamily P-loop ATPase
MSSAPSLPKIAIASGKGGTGKTTVACNLALTLARAGKPTTYIDCDVEEPNGHIFLKPDIDSSLPVCIRVPRVDMDKCTACGRCQEICQYSAIVVVKDKVLTFSDLCHACGGCAIVCPEGAITEQEKEIGVVESGTAGPLRFVQGVLRVGHASPTPVVRAAKKGAPQDGIRIFDVAPGTACPAVEAQRGCDFVVLVTEPTPFGLNDLGLAVETAGMLGLPIGVVVNRCDTGDSSVVEYCEAEGIDILAQIRDDRRIAESYSRGEIVIDSIPEYAAAFAALASRLMELGQTERAEGALAPT